VLIFHQKYEALSKERKLAARLLTATTANGLNAVTDLECVDILFSHWNDFFDRPHLFFI